MFGTWRVPFLLSLNMPFLLLDGFICLFRVFWSFHLVLIHILAVFHMSVQSAIFRVFSNSFQFSLNIANKIIHWGLVSYMKWNKILIFKNGGDCHTFWKPLPLSHSSSVPSIKHSFCVNHCSLGAGEIFLAILELIFLWGCLVNRQ